VRPRHHEVWGAYVTRCSLQASGLQARSYLPVARHPIICCAIQATWGRYGRHVAWDCIYGNYHTPLPSSLKDSRNRPLRTPTKQSYDGEETGVPAWCPIQPLDISPRTTELHRISATTQTHSNPERFSNRHGFPDHTCHGCRLHRKGPNTIHDPTADVRCSMPYFPGGFSLTGSFAVTSIL